jgi:hypothetical protein
VRLSYFSSIIPVNAQTPLLNSHMTLLIGNSAVKRHKYT